MGGLGSPIGAEGPGAARVVCLGEALIDLVCERPVASLGEATAFVPRLGGSLANIAVAAARHGAQVEMIGGAGDDEWGRWARDRLSAEGVGVERFALDPGSGTSHAFVSVSAEGEPSFAFYGGPGHPSEGAGPVLDEAIAGAPCVLVVGSDSIVGEGERAVTERAIRLARERGWQVLCDPNLRPNRWPDRETMLTGIRALAAAATTIKLNRAEALELTGAESVAGAAAALAELGPQHVVITLGAEGVALRDPVGELTATPAPSTELVDATGAGDAVAGVVAAALAIGGPDAIAPALPIAMRSAAGVVERWGALAGLPPAAEASASLAAALAG